MAKFDLPHDPVIASKIIEHEARKKGTSVGGRNYGRNFPIFDRKAREIAALALIISFALFGFILVCGVDTPTMTKKDELLMVGGFITLSLGFVFGRTTS